MNNKESVLLRLKKLGLSTDESKIYLELLKKERSHLELARATGVNRTKIYRIADDLQKRSLITVQTDDRGTFLSATDPSTLSVEITNKEELLTSQRRTLAGLLPELNRIQVEGNNAPGFFEVNTYEGIEGMKQMLWHELKATDEVILFGYGSIQDLVDSTDWAEKHRLQTISAGYKVREITNHGSKEKDFTTNKYYKKLFTKKTISKDDLLIGQQIVIYNDTVAVFNWKNGQRVGYEVINTAYSTMWRQLFEHYWKIAK